MIDPTFDEFQIWYWGIQTVYSRMKLFSYFYFYHFLFKGQIYELCHCWNFLECIINLYSKKSHQQNQVNLPLFISIMNFVLYRTNVFEERNVHSTMFRTLFLRGDIPCHRSFIKTIQPGTYLIWKIPPQDLDYSYYLPMFFDG